MSFTIFSFGFRYGAPEADEVFDLRCLKNPYWEPELRELCSQDAPVRDFILHNEQSRTVLNYALSMLLLQADLYAERGWGDVWLDGYDFPWDRAFEIGMEIRLGAFTEPHKALLGIYYK